MLDRQLFTYTNIGPVGGMSGVISPTNLSLFASSPSGGGGGGGSNGQGGANNGNNAPRTITPNQQHHANRTSSAPVSRWNTGSFIALDDNMDYGMMSPLIAGNNQDQQGPPLMDDGIYLARPHSPTRLAP